MPKNETATPWRGFTQATFKDNPQALALFAAIPEEARDFCERVAWSIWNGKIDDTQVDKILAVLGSY